MEKARGQDGKGKGLGWTPGKGGGDTGFQGNCTHCGAKGHKKSQCRKFDEVMRRRRAGSAWTLDSGDEGAEDGEMENEDEDVWGVALGSADLLVEGAR